MTVAALHPPPPPSDLAAALERIRASGGRVTAAKRQLVELLYSSQGALSVDEISALIEGVERSIIYRGLGQLEELGIAEHVHLGHGQAVYRRRGLRTVPVSCVGCGTTTQLDRAHIARFADEVIAATGIEPDLVHFAMTGRCQACRDADGAGQPYP